MGSAKGKVHQSVLRMNGKENESQWAVDLCSRRWDPRRQVQGHSGRVDAHREFGGMSLCRSIVQIIEDGDRMGVHACIEIGKNYNRFKSLTMIPLLCTLPCTRTIPRTSSTWPVSDVHVSPS